MLKMKSAIALIAIATTFSLVACSKEKSTEQADVVEKTEVSQETVDPYAQGSQLEGANEPSLYNTPVEKAESATTEQADNKTDEELDVMQSQDPLANIKDGIDPYAQGSQLEN